MASRVTPPAAGPTIVLPPVLAFALGVPAAPRSSVEAVIERMIDALDTLDGDENLEDGCDREGIDECEWIDEAEPDYLISGGGSDGR